MSCRLCQFPRGKHTGRNNIYWSSLPNFLLVHWIKILISNGTLLQIQYNLLPWWKPIGGPQRIEKSTWIEYDLSVHRNLLESGWGHYETNWTVLICTVLFKKSPIFIISPVYFQLNRREVSNEIVHQRNILITPKPVLVLFRPRAIPLCHKIWILSLNPVPLSVYSWYSLWTQPSHLESTRHI